MPSAPGRLLKCQSTPFELLRAGLKLLHTYTDQLWGMGTGAIPHPSFTPERIFPHVRLLDRESVKVADGPLTLGMCLCFVSFFAASLSWPPCLRCRTRRSMRQPAILRQMQARMAWSSSVLQTRSPQLRLQTLPPRHQHSLQQPRHQSHVPEQGSMLPAGQRQQMLNR